MALTGVVTADQQSCESAVEGPAVVAVVAAAVVVAVAAVAVAVAAGH